MSTPIPSACSSHSLWEIPCTELQLLIWSRMLIFIQGCQERCIHTLFHSSSHNLKPPHSPSVYSLLFPLWNAGVNRHNAPESAYCNLRTDCKGWLGLNGYILQGRWGIAFQCLSLIFNKTFVRRLSAKRDQHFFFFMLTFSWKYETKKRNQVQILPERDKVRRGFCTSSVAAAVTCEFWVNVSPMSICWL